MRVKPVLIICSLICLISFSSNSFAFLSINGSISLPPGETASTDLTITITVFTVGENPIFDPFYYYEEVNETVMIARDENTVNFSVPFNLIVGNGFTYGLLVYCSNCQTYFPGTYALQTDGSTSVTQDNGSNDFLSSSAYPRSLSSSLLSPLSPLNFLLVPKAGDIDEDTILNSEDNCILSANTDQVDTDHNGIGDTCDVDDDGDSILDLEDNCSLIANSDQTDSNDNGIGDACQQLETVDEDFCFPIFPVKPHHRNVAIICL